ncbi:MAG: class I SAM-dependent methyltransferase [Candidatus Omnitrophota bacterium]|nr:MAG: class I SAM-dependent methyltransferase [Candidatus Omnitrophota bacterium]
MNHKISSEKVLFCDLCRSPNKKIIDEEGAVVQCINCGLKYLKLRSSQKDIAVSYDYNYANYWRDFAPEAELMYERRCNFMQRFVRQGRVLDVGSGRGEFLGEVKKRGSWQCFGTETSSYALEFAKKKLDIELSLGQLEELNYPDRFFDAISFWHVLEHLPYPSRALKEARRILRDKGFLFIAVPNDSWLGRKHFFKNAFKKAINRLPLKNKLKLKKMYPQINEEGNKHLFYFTPRTLRELLKRCGFRIKAQAIDYDYEERTAHIERKYRIDSLICRLTGINFSNAILLAAEKKES